MHRLVHTGFMSENPNADILQRLEFTFADRLGKSLSAAGMSSAQMSDHLGVSRNTISNWINGKTTPRRSDLIVWAMRTGVPIEWIETGELKNPPGPNGPGGIDGECATRDSNPQPSDPKVGFLPKRANLPSPNVVPLPERSPAPAVPLRPTRRAV